MPIVDEIKELLSSQGKRDFGLQNYAIEVVEEARTGDPAIQISLWINPLDFRVIEEDTGRHTNLRLDMSFGSKGDWTSEGIYKALWKFFKEELDYAEQAGGIEGIRLERRNA